MPEETTVSISVSRKVNLGNYESADVFLSVSGLPVGASEQDVLDALETGEIAYEIVKRKAMGRFGGGTGTAGAERADGSKVGVR